jgi:hypothetical protein
MKLLSTIGILLLLSSYAFSQESSNDCPSLEIRSADRTANRWQRHFVGSVSVCLPIELRPVNLECFEGGCALFKSERFSFNVDFNLAAWRPTSQKYLPTYKEDFSTLNGKQAWIWYFERDGKYRGVSGVKLKVEAKNEYDLGLYFYSAEPGYRDLAETIFRSVKLLPIYKARSTK